MALGIAHKVIKFCQKNTLLTPNDKIIIGVSGGPDSLCLSHMLGAISQKFQLTLIIAHLNHQLRGAGSQADADFVKDMATRWQLPIFLETHNVANLAAERKQSLEETARQVRYAFLWRVATKTKANKIAVGHNADDQVETILMHFLRGTGLVGLRGMLPKIEVDRLHLYVKDAPTQSWSHSPQIIRPLLEVSRAEIETYCQENNLSPRQDSSNQDTTFFRNRLRHELLPYLESYNPKIRQALRRTAKVIAADTEILSEQMGRAWQLVIRDESPKIIEFDLERWFKLSLALKRSVLRRAIQTLHRSLRDISFEHVEHAINVLEKGGTGAKVTLPQGLAVRVGYHTFTIALENVGLHLVDFSGPQLRQGQILKVTLPGITALLDTQWQLKAMLLPYTSLNQDEIKQASRWEAYLDADVVGSEAILRTRQPGDVFYPLGMAGHSKKANKFMINEKIPANWRNHIPLFVSNNQILWVCGYRPDERGRLQSSTQRVLYLKFEAT